mmetsp:Transcript_25874/g.66704  ORF Transcript_25874/g.66704 Transcript_25874/m.66704 type:complete len:499 (+) Transcript_25874:102-1598(+)|eukprot:CAMPEP_0202375426 /NCGR_PEP_ID=MMETSP1127-20130417/6102_1 /ASSEMBLY_ACC=CAM_ASM_000462 /TAXON_ID=3047 /ORGANISM="Dunaliella tertiolecta, Strain CCMP1320" /LENGTH=498 /DNA_ID=CAMNT_0048972895 /DNA_START=56 /DNA_END=1552 /DNA_ORIENTATION=-
MASGLRGAISSGAASTPSRSMPKTTCSSKSSIAGTTRRPRLLLSHHSLHTNAYAYCSSHSTSQNALPLGNGLNKSSSTSSRRAGVRCQGLFDFLGGKGGAGGDKEGERARREAEEASKKRQEAEEREAAARKAEDEDEDEAAAAATLAGILRASMGLDSDKPRPNEIERSEMVNEEMVYFIFQMDLDVQLQRALNYEAYEFAQGVRAKRQRVDEALSVMMQRKVQNVNSEAASAAMDSGELAAEGLGLRTQMQRAVEEERYSDAARIRDMLADLERRAKRAEALAAEFKPSGVSREFRLGQRVKHRKFGYRGLVVGWDAQCCESDEWAEAAGVASLPRGSRQPFYQLLVDVRDWSFDYTLPPVAYVAEDFLWAPEQGGPEGMEALQAAQPGPGSEGSTAPSTSSSSSSSSTASGGSQEGPKIGEPMSWVERFGEGTFKHPYEYMLFLGQDARGDYIPCKQLRDRYNVQRRDVWAPGDDGTEDDEDDDGNDKPDIFPRI